MSNDDNGKNTEPKSSSKNDVDKGKARVEFYKQAKENRQVRLKLAPNDRGADVTADNENQLAGYVMLMQSLNIPDFDFANGIFLQLANASSCNGKPDEQRLNTLFSAVKVNKPRDANEVMLVSQMSVLQAAFMASAEDLANAQTDEQKERATHRLAKLAKTFATHMDTLQRYRAGREPLVVVQNVIATDGAQAAAVVSNVTVTNNEAVTCDPATTQSPQNDAKVTPIHVHARKQGGANER